MQKMQSAMIDPPLQPQPPVRWRIIGHPPLAEAEPHPFGEGVATLWGALVAAGWLVGGSLQRDLLLQSPDPDVGVGAMAGGMHGWVDFAAEIGAILATPEPLPGGGLLLRFSPQGAEARWMRDGSAERYVDGKGFWALNKGEHPGLLLPLLGALADVCPPDGGRVLLLGCHRGDELAALRALRPAATALEVVGVDHAPLALEVARTRFPEARWLCADVNALPEGLGRFDLVVANNLLQSPGVDAGRLLRHLVAELLAPAAGLLIGLPNGRFAAGQPVLGARTRNRREADLSLVVRDLAGHRRYLHQHGFQTRISGRYELLLSAWRGGAGQGRQPSAGAQR